MTRVAALFCCPSGPYAALGCDVFDLARDARTFDLSRPVVAHPPCRSWSRLAHFAKPRADERDLAIWAIWAVRHCGGVLEHPYASKLWRFFGVEFGKRDAFGGVLIPVQQQAFGHRAPKWTGLYCVRCEVRPAIVWGGSGGFVPVERMGRAERERTPVELARVLVDAAMGVQS